MGCMVARPVVAHVKYQDGIPRFRGFVELEPGLWRAQIPLSRSMGRHTAVAAFLIAPEARTLTAHNTAMMAAAARYSSNRSIGEPGSPGRSSRRSPAPGIHALTPVRTGSKMQLQPLTSTPHLSPIQAAPSADPLSPPVLGRPRARTPHSADSSGLGRASGEAGGPSAGWVLLDTGPREYAAQLLRAIEVVLEGSATPRISRVLVSQVHPHHIGALPHVLGHYEDCVVMCHPASCAILVRAFGLASKEDRLAGKQYPPCFPGSMPVPVQPVAAAADGDESKGDFTELGTLTADRCVGLADRDTCGTDEQSGGQVVCIFSPGHAIDSCTFVHSPTGSLLCGDVWANFGSFARSTEAGRDVASSYQVATAPSTPSAKRSPATLAAGPPVVQDVPVNTSRFGDQAQLEATMLKLSNVKFKRAYPSHDCQCGIVSADLGQYMTQPRFSAARRRQHT